MKKLFSIAAMALLSAPCVFSDAGQQVHSELEPESISDVLVLTEKNFDEKISSLDLALVEFYAPWCGYCQKLAPHYESAATTIKKDGIVLAKVDCAAQDDLCTKFGVRSYPTLKVFRKGEHQDYSGKREADAIVKYMQLQTRPAISELKSEDVESYSTSDTVVVIGFFSDANSSEFSELSAVANELRDDYRFGATFDADVATKFDVKVPGLILFKKFDEGKNVFADAFTEEAISSFVITNSFPLIGAMDGENYPKYVEHKLPIAYLFVSTESERADIGPKVEAVAKELKGKINFVYVDAVEFGSSAEAVNLIPNLWPAFAIENIVEKAMYPFDQTKEITTEAIAEFAKKVLDGTMKPKIKSEPIPTENDGPVKIIVGDTFEEIARDTQKDVFVEFYAIGCGFCLKLEPTYESLGKLYENAKDIVIAKMEAIKNDHDGVEVRGFPTLMLFKAGTNEVIEYNGNRTIESMVEFITENAASAFRPDKFEPSEEEEKHGDGMHDEL